MTTSLVAAAFLASTLGGVTTAAAQSSAPAAPAPPCQSEAYSHMDFWLGEWEADYGAATPGGPGVNRISRILDGCVILEEFDGGPGANGLIGRSWSTYHAGAGTWRQTWVDNQGGYFALVGGRSGDDFILTNTRLSDRAPYLRMVYEDIQPDSFTWRWQQSQDAGATWEDKWVIHYRRKAP